MVKQLSSGMCIAMEISHPDSKSVGDDDDSSVVSRLRDLVGPPDPELARSLRPGSLRARYGLKTEENAVHCTDLPEDGRLEVEYFFKVLQM